MVKGDEVCEMDYDFLRGFYVWGCGGGWFVYVCIFS